MEYFLAPVKIFGKDFINKLLIFLFFKVNFDFNKNRLEVSGLETWDVMLLKMKGYLFYLKNQNNLQYFKIVKVSTVHLP
jgi:hypothetical protein